MYKFLLSFLNHQLQLFTQQQQPTETNAIEQIRVSLDLFN